MRLGKDRRSGYLASVPLFAGLSKRELGEVSGIAVEVQVSAGTVLIEEGSRGREFFVLVDGTATVTRDGETLNTVGSGSWFGEIALVAHVPRTATVTATSAARLLVVNERAFADLMARVPSIAPKVLATLGERLAEHQRAD